MNKKFIKFDDIDRNNIDINRIAVSDKVPFGKGNFNYFIGNKDGNK